MAVSGIRDCRPGLDSEDILRQRTRLVDSLEPTQWLAIGLATFCVLAVVVPLYLRLRDLNR